MDRLSFFISIILLIILIFSTRGNAQVIVALDYIPIVTSGNQFPDFSGAPVEELFLYTYRSGNWEMIPVQIDERNSQGDYFLPDDIPGLDDNDELSFLLSDVGDLYPTGPNAWIANFESQLNPRYQIEVTDSTSVMNIGYVYLYRSNTLINQTADYIEYRPGPPQISAADTIQGLTFTLGHHEKGFVDFLGIHPVVGGSGIDLLDRQKFRIEIEFIFPILVNENDFQNAVVPPDRVVDGPIRVLKEVNLDVIIFGTPINLSLFMQYFPYSLSLSTALNLDSIPLPLQLIRQSLDFNENTIGMTFHNMNVPGGVTIDGNPDAVPQTPVLFYPEVNWSHITGNPGTVVMLSRFAPLGTALFGQYYKDDDVIDPDDTGDGKSFGDNGLLITGLQSSTGQLPLDINGFFLPPNLPALVGEQLAELQKSPPQLNLEVQNYSSVSALPIAGNNIPLTYELKQNYPNPFNPTTVISWQLPVSSPVVLSLFNLSGQRVTVLINEMQSTGFHQIEFDATGLASGIYLYRLQAGGYSEIKKMIVMK